MSDADYMSGKAMMAAQVLRGIAESIEDPNMREHALAMAYLQEIRSVVISLCGEYGDLDFDDKLYIVDMLRKHLEPYLTERKKS